MPSLREEGGAPPPRRLRLAARAMRVPGPPGALLRRAARKYLPGRLPDLVCDYPDGRSFRLPGGDASYALVFIEGEWEPRESELLRRVLRPGDLALDAGASHGWHTLIMAGAVRPGGSVLACEPLAEARAELEANLERSGATNVRIAGCALGSSEGETTLYRFAGLSSVHCSQATLGRSDGEPRSVPLTTLDRLMGEGGQLPTLIKVDIEGAELDALRGARSLLSSAQRPIVMLEVNYETAAAFGHRPAELLAELSSAGQFDCFRLVEDGLIPETDAEAAPQDSTWVCVPDHLLHRVRPLARANEVATGD